MERLAEEMTKTAGRCQVELGGHGYLLDVGELNRDMGCTKYSVIILYVGGCDVERYEN